MIAISKLIRQPAGAQPNQSLAETYEGAQLTFSLCSYSGPRKGDDMLAFIKQQVVADKGFARVEILDTLAQQFRSAPDLSTIISQLIEKAGSLTEDAQKTAGELYVKYGQKAAEKVRNAAALMHSAMWDWSSFASSPL